MRRLFIDTSALYALADADDAFHAKARAISSVISKNNWEVFTSNYVVAETHALILSRMRHERGRKWLKNFDLRVEQAGPEDQEAGKGIIFRQKDKNCSLVDAISFVLMERLHAESAFTFDPHFEQYGFKVLVE